MCSDDPSKMWKHCTVIFFLRKVLGFGQSSALTWQACLYGSPIRPAALSEADRIKYCGLALSLQHFVAWAQMPSAKEG